MVPRRHASPSRSKAVSSGVDAAQAQTPCGDTAHLISQVVHGQVELVADHAGRLLRAHHEHVRLALRQPRSRKTQPSTQPRYCDSRPQEATLEPAVTMHTMIQDTTHGPFQDPFTRNHA